MPAGLTRIKMNESGEKLNPEVVDLAATDKATLRQALQIKIDMTLRKPRENFWTRIKKFFGNRGW